VPCSNGAEGCDHHDAKEEINSHVCEEGTNVETVYSPDYLLQRSAAHRRDAMVVGDVGEGKAEDEDGSSA
jgi:hypothetical protein